MKRSTRARVALVVRRGGRCARSPRRPRPAPTSRAAGSPIVIGWAYDSNGRRWRRSTGRRSPRRSSGRSRSTRRAASTGVRSQIKTCDTQGNKPAIAKACADKLIAGGANIIFTTCDVDFAAPVVQESINRGVLTVAPCIGTDQMGPKRFGPKGTLAFSFGNVAQDEGSAMAQYAWGRGWRTAALATDTVIVYFKNVVAGVHGPLEAARRQDRRPGDVPGPGSAATTSRTSSATRRNVKADVIVTSTAGAFGALAPLVTGLRTRGNNTPILNSWAGDGTYWLPKSPKVTNYYFVTYASTLRRRPEPGGQQAREAGPRRRPAASSPARPRSTASSPRSARRAARRTARRSRRRWRSSTRCRRCRASSASRRSCTRVFGRQYRVIKIQNNVATARRRRRREGRPEDLGGGWTPLDQQERRPGGTLRASSVSRSFEGVAGAARRHRSSCGAARSSA